MGGRKDGFLRHFGKLQAAAIENLRLLAGSCLAQGLFFTEVRHDRKREFDRVLSCDRLVPGLLFGTAACHFRDLQFSSGSSSGAVGHCGQAGTRI